MASCITLKQMYLQDDRRSDTPSEISSTDSDWSDLKSIATQLGVSNVDDLYTERFKIDRQKLSDMIQVETQDGESNCAEQFFSKVMIDTTTHISWPCRLKLGAKTKKDPHVRIIGRRENVLKAKDKIMLRLDSRGNRVIMKMDVSYTDHSYIIGRGGNNIKRIMEDTHTHIHFPDSNRSNPIEKSNQVSICGDIEGTEKARAMVRLCTPLLFSFELPITGPGKPQPDNDTPFVKEIEKEYNVQVIFSSRPKLHSALVLIKGSEMEVVKVKEATRRLIDLICSDIAHQIPVQMQLEISIQHHAIVVGRASSNLREIMNKTGAKIMFPDANDINIKPIKRSQITITGSINGVYLARQLLIGNLPVALIFDYPDSAIDSEIINKLMYTYDVFIAVRQKSRQSTLCIVIKGIEKFISNIYEARYQLLKLNGHRITADIPSTYYLPGDKNQQKTNSLISLLASNVTNPFSPLSPLPPMPWVASLNGTQSQQSYGYRQYHNLSLTPTASSSMPDISNTRDYKGPNTHINSRKSQINNSPRNISELHSSGYQSMNCSRSSMSSLENPSFSLVDTDECNAGLIQESNNDSEKSLLNDTFVFNFDPRIVAGYNAMNNCPHGELRTPNLSWQGLALSKTTPNRIETSYGVSPFRMTTSLMDSMPKQQRERLSQYNDVASILTSIGLEHHIQYFVKAEIDMSVFPTLTDNDLINLGIKTLGARRKILMAIHDVAARQNRSSPLLSTSIFSGSAAPGAERRGSTGNI